ncbi:MAG: YbhB/YbcL family Raf kinase inhibitor-like protein, partial [Candidatus Polarisedimenticolia bacterium]
PRVSCLTQEPGARRRFEAAMTAPAALQLTSSAFIPGGDIPTVHTCDGPDISPPLAWTEPPQGTRSLALICDDPDAPSGTWVHWVLFNLPPETRSLSGKFPTDPELPTGARQGKTDFGRVGYGGPCPPPGPPHRYFFRVYALDAPLSVDAGARKADVEKAMRGHVLAQGELMGRYGR